MTNRESLVAALEEAEPNPLVVALNICGWYHHGEPDRPLPDDPALLSTLIAHASPEAKAAALRGLLIARLEGDGMPVMPLADQVAAGEALAVSTGYAGIGMVEVYGALRLEIVRRMTAPPAPEGEANG